MGRCSSLIRIDDQAQGSVHGFGGPEPAARPAPVLAGVDVLLPSAASHSNSRGSTRCSLTAATKSLSASACSGFRRISKVSGTTDEGTSNNAVRLPASQASPSLRVASSFLSQPAGKSVVETILEDISEEGAGPSTPDGWRRLVPFVCPAKPAARRFDLPAS